MSEPTGRGSQAPGAPGSLDFWHESDARLKQFWYVSFCLMMSAVQDRLTGLALAGVGNRNWATTAFYYSGVHAGRLLCFLCFGNYPTRHDQLARLLEDTNADKVKLDGLSNLLRPVGRTDVPSPTVTHANLRGGVERLLCDESPLFDDFAPLLAKFKDLRNDCNYEALLIAHERNHDLVAPAFEDLVRAAGRVARLAVDVATSAYIGSLRTDFAFGPERTMFEYAHSEYLRSRFQAVLVEKFRHSSVAREELERLTKRLEVFGADPRTEGQDLNGNLDAIMYDTFGEKQGLMRRWVENIRSLEETLQRRCER